MPVTSSYAALRLIGRMEALSFLALLGFAMPMKYIAAKPEFVLWTGWVHGVLFIAYLGLVAHAWQRHAWPMSRPALLLLAALLPFGPFLVEPRLRRWKPGPG